MCLFIREALPAFAPSWLSQGNSDWNSDSKPNRIMDSSDLGKLSSFPVARSVDGDTTQLSPGAIKMRWDGLASARMAQGTGGPAGEPKSPAGDSKLCS
ncbi:hypothetical protein ACFWBS_42550 [Streptomyces mirabilis]|uniref:hypothetical protein n=1 Tax=Streptomyces TaxID=1883 RepID=UPI00117C9CE2|nr:hypothetical protein [Streptomyces sp. OK228]